MAVWGRYVCAGIIGDHDPGNATHAATGVALARAAHDAIGASVDAEWLPTDTLEGRAEESVHRFDALFCSPSSPYRSLAREDKVPFTGTCGGFQHAVIEHARNVLGTSDAGHAEYDPGVSALGRYPFGEKMRVEIEPDSRAHELYGGPGSEEEYRCNYGLTPENRGILEEGGLRISGTDPGDEVLALELPGHSFYVATLFVPQLQSSEDQPHPLIVAFLRAGLEGSREPA